MITSGDAVGFKGTQRSRSYQLIILKLASSVAAPVHYRWVGLNCKDAVYSNDIGPNSSPLASLQCISRVIESICVPLRTSSDQFTTKLELDRCWLALGRWWPGSCRARTIILLVWTCLKCLNISSSKGLKIPFKWTWSVGRYGAHFGVCSLRWIFMKIWGEKNVWFHKIHLNCFEWLLNFTFF